jgi:uncharacterized cupin superfamily protein
VPEARLIRRNQGLLPTGAGWFVVSAREARWYHSSALGSYCKFEGSSGSGARFTQVGININVLHPGQPSSMYHAEDAQEGFLVLSGECVLVVEGEERMLGRWDFFHCPAGTEHVLVGAGTEPCVFVAVGARRKGRAIRYAAAEVAQRHSAGVVRETTSPRSAYKHLPPTTQGPYRDLDLPTIGRESDARRDNA